MVWTNSGPPKVKSSLPTLKAPTKELSWLTSSAARSTLATSKATMIGLCIAEV